MPAGLPDARLIKLYEDQIAGTSDEIKNLSEEMKGWNLIVDEQRLKIVAAITAVNDKRAEAVQSTIRANTAMELSDNRADTANEKASEERIKRLEEFVKATIQLQDEFEKSQIEQLSGKEKIKAEEDYQVKQIQMLEDHLKSLGELTAEHYRMLDALREKAHNEALIAESAYDVDFIMRQQAANDKVLQMQRDVQEEALNLLSDNEKAKIDLQIQFLGEDLKKLQDKILSGAGTQEDSLLFQLLSTQIKGLKKKQGELTKEGEEFSIWKMIGLGDSPEAQDAIKAGHKGNNRRT